MDLIGIGKSTREKYDDLKKEFNGINSVTLKYAELKASAYMIKAISSTARKLLNGIILKK